MTPLLITIKGETRSVKDWSRQPGAAAYLNIILRLKRGWDAEEAIFAPLNSHKPRRSDRSHKIFKARRGHPPPEPVRPATVDVARRLA